MKSVRVFARTVLVAFVIMIPASAARAEPVVVDWYRTPPLSGTVEGDAVRIQSPAGGGAFPLIVIENPPVGGTDYAIVGRIRFEAVQGSGYLEMWSVFGDGTRYFSRTLGGRGPLAPITGRSGWRSFELGFHAAGQSPARLEVNLVLPGSGTVWVGPMRIQSIRAGDGSAGWWSGRAAGLIGAIGGTIIGMLGALLGGLTSRRRARSFVLGAMLVLVVVGGACLVAGMAALVLGQPYAVYFPVLLIGVILLAVFGNGRRAARRTYEDAELRRMRALDLSRP